MSLDQKENARRSILVADDDPHNVRAVGSLLKEDGYQIHVANSGEQALAIAGEVPLDLILLDIRMPRGMDGIETCRRLKADDRTRPIPVIFLTGREDEETTVRAFAAGGADYVKKPFDAQVLLARVRTQVELGLLSRALELALAERTRELRDANARLRQLALEVSLIEERERKRLAGDLHDSPMQKLALAQMQIAAAAKCRDGESEAFLESGLELMREALRELRSLQFELSPPCLHQEGLAPALQWLASHATRRFGVAFSVALPPALPTLDPRRAGSNWRREITRYNWWLATTARASHPTPQRGSRALGEATACSAYASAWRCWAAIWPSNRTLEVPASRCGCRSRPMLTTPLALWERGRG